MTFESAHIAREKEEHAAVTMKIPFNPSDLQHQSQNLEKLSTTSSLLDYAMQIDDVVVLNL